MKLRVCSLRVRLLLMLCLLLTTNACSKSQKNLPAYIKACPSPSPKMASNGKLKLFIPNDFWDENFSRHAAKAGLSDLKTTVLPGNDLEVRIWAFAFNDIGCVAFKRVNGKFSALRVPMIDSDRNRYVSEPYPEPASGWDAFWNKLVSEGVLSLPDSSCFTDGFAVLDGIGYLIEINTEGNYRLYGYSSPSIRTPEHGATDLNGIMAAKQMDNIAGLILDERFFLQNK